MTYRLFHTDWHPTVAVAAEDKQTCFPARRIRPWSGSPAPRFLFRSGRTERGTHSRRETATLFPMRPSTKMMEIKYVLDCPLHPRVTPTKLYSDVKEKSRYFIVRVASRSWQDPTISVISPCMMVANPATIKKANKKNIMTVVRKHESCREKWLVCVFFNRTRLKRA